MANRLSVTEHHSTSNPSEVVRVDIDTSQGKYAVVVQYLGSQNCVTVDVVYPDEERLQVENILL